MNMLEADGTYNGNCIETTNSLKQVSEKLHVLSTKHCIHKSNTRSVPFPSQTREFFQGNQNSLFKYHSICEDTSEPVLQNVLKLANITFDYLYLLFTINF